MSGSPSLERALARERILVLAGLATLTVLAWIYLLSMAADMSQMGDAMLTTSAAPWSATEFGLMFVMWGIMMVGMMLPSATPMILLFAAVNRRRGAQGQTQSRTRDQTMDQTKDQTRGETMTPTAVFVAGYIAVWTAFSLAATALQALLHRVGLLSPMMVTSSTLLGGAVLIAAGLYQWTPLKGSCLRHCQSPLHFITQHWRRGTGGAFRMGAEHGVYCLGCCWVLMCLLFVGGVMNLLWIAGLALFVLLEKVAPRRWSPWMPMTSGVVLVVWGVLILVRGAL